MTDTEMEALMKDWGENECFRRGQRFFACAPDAEIGRNNKL
jgi:hypothetical protein